MLRVGFKMCTVCLIEIWGCLGEFEGGSRGAEETVIFVHQWGRVRLEAEGSPIWPEE